jgi:hypothetical protein
MPCCVGFRGPEGVPLDEITLSEMPPDEKAFWRDFLHLADKEVREHERNRDEEPYVPSDALATAFWKAANAYDGMQYCQMKQLARRFSFAIHAMC